MSSFQVWIAIIGWIFLFYLNNRTLRRSEIARQKDRLVERVDAIRDWYVDEIRLDESTHNRMSLEQNLASQVTQVEIRIRQLNHYVKCEIVSPNSVARIRGIDNSTGRSLWDIIEDVHVECSELNETIEIAYDNFFSERNFMRRLWCSYGYELLGGIFVLSLWWLILKVTALMF